MNVFDKRVIKIAAGQSLSESFLMEDHKIIGLCLPANIDGATTITFQTKNPVSKTFENLYDDAGAEAAVSVAAGRHVSFDKISSILAPWSEIKLRLGNAATPVVATADREIVVVLKE